MICLSGTGNGKWIATFFGMPVAPRHLDTTPRNAQIVEAIGVGIEMGGGPATVSSRFAMKVLAYYTE